MLHIQDKQLMELMDTLDLGSGAGTNGISKGSTQMSTFNDDSSTTVGSAALRTFSLNSNDGLASIAVRASSAPGLLCL